MTSEERFVGLEVRGAHLEKQLAELSDVLYQQQKELDALRQKVRRLEDKLASDPGLVDATRNDRPPHY